MAHHCHWPSCDVEVPAALWGCKKHWFALPKNLRDAIWRTYRPGQEITKTPSKAYLEVAREVQEWIAIWEQNPINKVARVFKRKPQGDLFE